MKRIGPRNWPYLEKLTIAMPLRSVDRFGFGWTWIPNNWERCNDVYQKMPFSFPSLQRGHFVEQDYERPWSHFTRKLAKAVQLESLDIFIPEHCDCNWYLGKHPKSGCKGFERLSASKPFLELHVIRMVSIDGIATELKKGHISIIKTLKAMAISRIRFAPFVIQGKWCLTSRQRWVDKYGRTTTRAHDATETFLDTIPHFRDLFGAA
jgi:hypothetical protein